MILGVAGCQTQSGSISEHLIAQSTRVGADVHYHNGCLGDLLFMEEEDIH
jgi:hypothetical protein